MPENFSLKTEGQTKVSRMVLIKKRLIQGGGKKRADHTWERKESSSGEKSWRRPLVEKKEV